MSELRTITLGARTLSYTLERKRVKNINLRVRPDGSIHVSAPPLVPTLVIESFLRSRAGLLLRALDRAGAAPARSFADGSTLYYLGRPRRLKLTKGGRSAVSVTDETLELTLREPGDGESVRRALLRWYRAESERLCRMYCERLLPSFAPCGVGMPEIRMRSMRSLWGNCRPTRGVVTFNSMLAAADEDCIAYVVAHELTHFLHADHSRAFRDALARVIPDWKVRRKRLNTYTPQLFS